MDLLASKVLVLIKKFILILSLMLLFGVAASAVEAQQRTEATDPVLQKEAVHLNTIGAFSAGFVLQSYGYIGVLADAMSKGVYAPDLVRSMLAETRSYLRNVHTQLQKYQAGDMVAAGDQKFISAIMEIIEQLIAEAEALSAFAQTKSEVDLKRFEKARKQAWTNIKKTFSMK